MRVRARHRTAWLLAGLIAGAVPVGGQVSSSWKQADPSYRLVLPRDHAAHPEYRIEWWYYTGNLAAADGRRFGYQLTFFRVGVDPAPSNPSRWAVRDLHMAHLAVTDIDGGRYRFNDRLNRDGPGWAGAATDRYRVWNELWEATLDEAGRHVLRARDGGLGVDLVLTPSKPPVLHGDQGYSRKGGEEGNASHYYSLTRMETSGRLWIEGEEVAVRGASWMDHEFGTSFLERGQRGWDWFSMQFDDGHELMLFQMRRSDAARDPRSSGTWVLPDGRTLPIGADDFRLEPLDRWRSAESGAEYPTRWRLIVPRLGLDVEARAALPNQELRTTRSANVTYWEGSIHITGRLGGRVARGRGYLEMTGYTGQPMSEVFRE